MSQISRNGQLYTEPTFQVFRKDNSGTFEKYQQLRIGDYEILLPQVGSSQWRTGDERKPTPIRQKHRNRTRAGTVSQSERD